MDRRDGLTGSTIWAFVVLALGFMALTGFLVSAGRSAEFQRMLVLVGQGFIGAIQVWIVYRSSLSTNKKVDTVSEKAAEVAQVTEHIKDVVDGTTPQPGTLPKVTP